MNYKNRISIFILLSIIAVACSLVSVPKVTDIPTIPEFTKTLKPTAKNFLPVTAKILQTITKTMRPTIEVTSTLQPEILAEVATLDTIVTEKPELEKFYDRLCITDGICSYSSHLGLSPNTKWAVFFSTKKGTGGLSIVNVTSKKQWDISYYDITGKSRGDVTVEIEHWSHDGYYLYVSPSAIGEGGLFWFWRNYIHLIRINLENGTWADTKMGTAFSFSPNDRFIAFRRGQNLVIHEFQTGHEQIFTVPAEYVAFGRFVWSADSNQIIFVSSSVEELLASSDKKPNGFTLFLLNVDDMKVQAILEKDERYLYPLEWQTSNIVLLESLYEVAQGDNLESSDEKYKLDLGTNEVSKYESP